MTPMHIRGNSFSELYLNVLDEILMNGKRVNSRNGPTLELHPCCLELTRPLKRQLILLGRGNNPFATLAETLWVYSGNNRIDWLLPFVPRAHEYSDDKKVWRAGYAPRLLYWRGFNDKEERVYVNQIDATYRELRSDLESRRAVITIWDPAKETTCGKSLDYPCSDLLQFLYRNGLDLTLYIRSNDAMYGLGGINLFEWTVLQECMANALQVPVGNYYHFANSLHLYTNLHEEKAKKILKLNKNTLDLLENIPAFEFSCTNLDVFRTMCVYICEILNYASEKELSWICNDMGFGGQVSFMPKDIACTRTISRLLYLYLLFLRNRPLFDSIYEDVMKTIPFSDLKLACHFWVKKNTGTVVDDLKPYIDDCVRLV